MIKTECFHCGQKYEVEEEYLNQEVECTSCNNNFVVIKLNPLQKVKSSEDNSKEVLLFIGNPSLKKYLSHFITAGIVALLGILLYLIFIIDYTNNKANYADIAMPVFSVIFSLFILIAFLISLNAYLLARYTKYTLTNKKIDCNTGFLNTSKTSLYIKDIREISSSQSLYERIFNLGTISISSSATSFRANLKMVGIKNYESVIKIIEDIRKS